MPRIDPYTIERIKDAANIVEVVSDVLGWYDQQNPTGLKKVGVRYTAICPFHEDHHMGNFIVYPKKNCYRCFACEAKGGAIDFLMKHENLSYADAIRWLGKKYGIATDMKDFNYTPPPPRPRPAPLPMLVLPRDMVMRRMNIDGNNLVTYLRTQVNWDNLQRKRLEDMLHDYCIGASKNGMTIFWQIDESGKVRTGKMMKYYPEGHPKFGHRDKVSRFNIDWVHAALYHSPRYPQYDDSKMEMHQCLFGLHLLNYYKKENVSQAVHLVESEKTALIMATAYGNHAGQIWMATGGMENLTREKLKPLINQHCYIVCYPDRDGIEKWQKKIDELRYDRISIDTRAVTEWWQPCDGDKADIADVVLRMINGRGDSPSKILGDLTKEHPAIQTLINKLELKPAEDER